MKKNEEGIPIIPKLPDEWPPMYPEDDNKKPTPHDGCVAICGQCGLRIMTVMMRSPSNRCTAGFGSSTTCSAQPVEAGK